MKNYSKKKKKNNPRFKTGPYAKFLILKYSHSSVEKHSTKSMPINIELTITFTFLQISVLGETVLKYGFLSKGNNKSGYSSSSTEYLWGEVCCLFTWRSNMLDLRKFQIIQGQHIHRLDSKLIYT